MLILFFKFKKNYLEEKASDVKVKVITLNILKINKFTPS